MLDPKLKIEHFGLVEAEVDHVLKQVTLTVKRGRDPLGQSVIERCMCWALSRCRDDYPDYHIIVSGEEECENIGYV